MKKQAPVKTGACFFGGEDATRTHNALRHTTFPMWLLTIRIPLHMQFYAAATDSLIIIADAYQKSKRFFEIFFKIMQKFTCTFPERVII